jgi:hypothetical protein
MSENGTRLRWTGERIARLGFLIGLGWDAKRVAEDPIIASTPNNVHRQAQRFGLSFRSASTAISLQSSPETTRYFEQSAFIRGVSYDALIQRLLREIASDPPLLDNILDDDGGAA